MINELNRIYSFHITNACFWSLLTIANTLMMLDLELVEYFSTSVFLCQHFQLAINHISFLLHFPFSKAAKNLLSADLFKTFTYLSWAFATIAYYCEFGQLVSDNFEFLNEKYSTVNWYLLSTKMQQMFLIIIVDNHRLTTIRGYGNIRCVRGTFEMVIFIDFNRGV